MLQSRRIDDRRPERLRGDPILGPQWSKIGYACATRLRASVDIEDFNDAWFVVKDGGGVSHGLSQYAVTLPDLQNPVQQSELCVHSPPTG
jgi:hypothetical protein